MGQAISVLLFLLLLGATFTASTWVLAMRLSPETKHERMRHWLLVWLLKGLALPLVLWMLLNLGLSLELQPFMPSVQAAKNHGGNWAPAYLVVVATGLFIVSSYWSALTLGWLLVSASRAVAGPARKDLKELYLTCLLVLVVPAGLVVLLGGLSTAGLAGLLLLAPTARYAQNLVQPPKMPPMYARAVARMKFGKYSEAEWEIIKELENWEDDFEGWIMLADLYANHFNNLPEAEQTVLELCNQEKTSPSHLAVALHRLADWHLKLAKDPDAARRALRMIGERLPGTHLAHMAQLRINQLPASAAELRDQQTAQAIPLPALGDRLDEPAQSSSASDSDKAVKSANAYVEQLKLNPDNAAAREKLARILAERLNKPDLGIEQIELLLDMPGRSQAERAEWLGLIAAWHLKYRNDVESARKCLERLRQEFPGTPQALAAGRRLELLERQLRGARQ
jgi:hypothetical protein